MDKFAISIVSTVLIAIIVAVGVTGFFNRPQPNNLGTVAGTSDAQVTASVYACVLDLIVRPEKRIPRTGNWDTTLTVQIYQSGNSVGSFQTNTNEQGRSIVNICDLGFNLTGGTYSFRIRGFSHLFKIFPDESTFFTAGSIVHYTSTADVLLAGETSNVSDNYINSLDISTQIVALYTSDNKNDLNQDTQVNSLDFSNTITNFFVSGE